jgi:WD40 repeat protein
VFATLPLPILANGLKNARRFSLVCLFGLCVLGTSSFAQTSPAKPAAAETPRVGPFLRIDPGTHTALVRGAAFDAAKERVYTASDDKTIRVWQLPSGKLLSTLRIPILEGAEGQIYAISLSSDGRWLAVGGWTGWDWERKASVYIFDTQTEQMVQRLAVAPWTITSLRFAPDGEHLAVGMHGEGGLVIVQRSTGKVVASDTAYRNKVMDMDFDPYGRLFTIGLDGFVRLYKQDFSLLARRAAQAAKDPVAIRVSPDGERVSLGFADAAVLELLSTRDLGTIAQLKAPASAGQKDFVTVAWSGDGQYIYAAGDAGAGRADVFRWPLKGGAANLSNVAPQGIEASSARINELWQLSKGRVLYVTDAPSVGWIEANGQVRQPIAPAQWDFAGKDMTLQVSANASVVSVSVGGRVMSYQVGAARLDWQAVTGVQRPVTQAPGWAVKVSNDLRALQLNGQNTALEEYERVRSHAIAPNRNFVAVGTEWALRNYNSRGELQWLARVSSPVWAVNVSADNKVVVAAIGDGTLRWFSAQTGKELLSVFMHKNATDWIAWVPGGYYASSPFGDKHIGWHINRGLDIAPDFVYAVQLERVLYRPDLVRTALGTLTGQGPAERTDVAMTPEQMAQMAPPRLRLRLLGIDASKSSARLVIEGERAGPQMQDIAVYVNDIPVTPAKERGLSAFESRQFRREYEVPLSRPINDIRVEAFAGVSMGLARIQAELPTETAAQTPGGDLYVLAIGASRFDNLPESTWLSFAAKDAETFAQTLQNTSNTPFAKRHVRVISDSSREQPTRSNILAALDFIKNAKAQDTVVLFLASHGLSDTKGNYYFVPKDVAASDLKGLSAIDQPQTLLSWQVFFDALRVVAGQRILVVDTCQAKGIAGRFDPNALIKRSASSQFALMLASGENEESQEYDPGGHGLFTYGLLSSLSEAQKSGNASFSLRDWFSSTAKVVQRFRDRSIGPQTPQLLAPAVLEQAVLLARR